MPTGQGAMMRRAVLMIVDGLRADLVRQAATPHLAALGAVSRNFTAQRSVFPTATRVNAASIATGCVPARHGLAGNAIALDEGEGLKAVSVGPAEFRDRLRRATGRTLWRPTMSEWVREHGGAVIFSNSSAGAAHMLDPDGHGWLYHRSGSFAPGLVRVEAAQHLDVSYDGAGNTITTQRFCDALLAGDTRALWIIWICEPDHSQHDMELGSPGHLAVLVGADACAGQVYAAVNALRGRGEEVMFIAGADHGHETVDEIIDVEARLVEAGLKQARDSTDVVIASSGMGGLLYLDAGARTRVAEIATWLRAQTWTDRVYAGDELAEAGQCTDTGVAIAFGMAKRDEPNRFGVMGLGHVIADRFMPHDATGNGQHGGFGPYESNPFLFVNGAGFTVGTDSTPTSTTDIAPTMLDFLGVPFDDMDGTVLPRT